MTPLIILFVVACLVFVAARRVQTIYYEDQSKIKALHEELELAKAQLVAIRGAVDPVIDWYQSDEHNPRDLKDIIFDAIEDLVHDRKVLIEKERKCIIEGCPPPQVHGKN